MHFVLALAIGLGMTPQSFFEKFLDKQRVNRERAFSGTYDGIQGKCIRCTRDAGDVHRASGLEPVKVAPGKVLCGACFKANAAVPE
jgi:hypothetical protein